MLSLWHGPHPDQQHVDEALLAEARRATNGVNDATLFDQALTAPDPEAPGGSLRRGVFGL